jgi:AraC family transcriptional regulator
MEGLAKGTHVSSVINSIETPQLIASCTILHPAQYNGYEHYHDNAHFSFVLSGGCREKKQASYNRLPGSITWYEAGERHQISKVPTPSYHVNFELTDQFFSTYDINPASIARALQQHPDIRCLMLNVFRELQHPDSDAIISLQQLLLNIVSDTSRLLLPGIPAWVKTIKEILHDQWNDTLTLEELSVITGVHPVTISKYFPSYFSCTLGEYRRKLKINRAIEKMNQPFYTGVQLAYASGFADESHFIRVFKKMTGLSPRHFKSEAPLR